MLKKSHITNIDIYSDEWHLHRIGKLTSSKMFHLTGGQKGLLTYMYQKVGELITGISNDKETSEFNEDTEWGLRYEKDAVMYFGEQMGIEFLVVQKMIAEPMGCFSSTPDGIWVHRESLLNSEEYNVSTLEVKCPRTYNNFIPLFLCDTPEDVFRLKKEYYWQVVDQMDQCGAAHGYLCVYHPYFPKGNNFKVIHFRKMELWDNFKRLLLQKQVAIQKLQEIQKKMICLHSKSS